MVYLLQFLPFPLMPHHYSAISLLLSEGVPIQIVQQRAGHQDPKITLAVYSHVSKDKESLVADTLGEILFVWHENLQADK